MKKIAFIYNESMEMPNFALQINRFNLQFSKI